MNTARGGGAPLLVAALVAVCSATAPTPALAVAQPSCRALAGAKFLAGSSRAAVFAVRQNRSSARLFACVRGRAAQRLLDLRDGSPKQFTKVAVRWPYVVYVIRTDSPRSADEFAISVASLAKRRVTGSSIDAGSAPPRDLQLSTQGPIAWRTLTGSLFAADARGRRQVTETVDSGSSAFSVSGRRLYWTIGGAPQSMLLTPGLPSNALAAPAA